MKKPVEKMSLEELKALKKEVETAIASFQDRKRQEALKAMEAVAREHGMSLEEIIAGTKKRRKAKAAPKYRNPLNAAETWSGKGRQPGWFKDAIKGGKKAEDLAV